MTWRFKVLLVKISLFEAETETGVSDELYELSETLTYTICHQSVIKQSQSVRVIQPAPNDWIQE